MSYSKLLESINIKCVNCNNNLAHFYNLGQEISLTVQCGNCDFINNIHFDNHINYEDFDPIFMDRLYQLVYHHLYNLSEEYDLLNQIYLSDFDDDDFDYDDYDVFTDYSDYDYYYDDDY